MNSDDKSSIEERRWVFELIVENLPPFSFLPRKYSVFFQLLFLELAGILIGIIFKLSFPMILLGSVGIMVAVLWSVIILQLAPVLRSFRVPLSKGENLLLERYKKILFHRHYLELLIGIVVFAAITIYLLTFYRYFSEISLINYWFGNEVNPILLAVTFVLIWDICYRMGVGIWISYLTLWRSIKLRSFHPFVHLHVYTINNPMAST